MNIQQTETMLNLTRFQKIKFMHKYSFLEFMSCLVTKCKTRIIHPLLNIYEHYYTLRCNNVTENDKMNKTKNNERQ